MRTITVDDLTRQPLALIEDAQRGNPVIVSSGGEPLLLALSLGTRIAPQRLDEMRTGGCVVHSMRVN